MKIIPGTGDYDKARADIRIYAYYKEDLNAVLEAVPVSIAKHIGPRLKSAKNGLRFLSQDGVWYSFIKLDEKKKVTPESFRRFGAGIAKEIDAVSADRATVIIQAGKTGADSAVYALTEGTVLGRYDYDELKTSAGDSGDGGKPRAPGPVLSIYDTDRGRIQQKVIERAVRVAEATNEARRLADTPSNMMTPTAFTNIVSAKAKKEGVRVKVLERSVLQKMGWGAFLGVARGSHEPPKVVILEYKASNRKSNHVIVGKGITFDSGGISIKPSSGMEDMKFDMAGAAAVAMTVILAARLKMPVNINAVIPLTENMPGGGAQKPGDVVRTLSGKTIEIISTDAEGRLILADALYYAARTYKPESLIDLATLTGACVVALGSEASGIMGNDDGLVKGLIRAGERSGDRLWELPLWDDYKDLIKSDVADMKNAGSRWAGTIQGGLLLKEFIKDSRWAHIDIAGTAYLDKPKPYFKKGATGAGVRLLIEFFEGM
ncbi:MAG: leucyl aminopeptidase [Deltaproteobacteria bacterium]|nr:leucyl aminopeptidase [Deltaproteobacteria bacterium]